MSSSFSLQWGTVLSEFLYTIPYPQCCVQCMPGLYLLQEASAVAGHGEVRQEREGELLDRAVIWGDPWGQLHDWVHQRVTKGAFRSWCSTGATAAKTTACWKEKNKQIQNSTFCLTWYFYFIKIQGNTGFTNIVDVFKSFNHVHLLHTCIHMPYIMKCV